MAIIYRNFRTEKDGTDLLGCVKNKDIIVWSMTRKPDAVEWKKDDKIFYNTDYVEIYDTHEMSLSDLFNVLLNELKSEEVKELLKMDEWLKEPFMMFLSNPFCNKEVKEKISKISNDSATASGMASLSFVKSLF